MNEIKIHRCRCRHKAEVHRLPLSGTYMVVCTNKLCGNKTHVHLSEEYAVKVWNEGAWRDGE